MKFPTLRRKTTPPVEAKAISAVSPRGGWMNIIREGFSGAWQQNVEISQTTVLAYHAVFSCMTLIAGDISKLPLRVVAKNPAGVWREVDHPVSALLRRPNHYQTTSQFIESWITSKLATGNTYTFKERNGRGEVTDLYVLDPRLVLPLITEGGEVYYQLSQDNLSGLRTSITVPASEIVHDRYNCIYHPLIGTSPIVASGLAAMQGNSIQQNATRLFTNASMPGGILTAPGSIEQETADRLKAGWEDAFNGKNYGKVAVLGDGLKFDTLAVKATDAQLIEQLRWTAEVVAATFHVPPYKIGVGTLPSYNNIQALTVEYFSQALQKLIEDIENTLDQGLGFARGTGVEFDIDGLLRMDSATLVTSLKDAVGAGIMAPNEARLRLNLGPVPGGDSPYLQQQNYSLEALSKRGADGLVIA